MIILNFLLAFIIVASNVVKIFAQLGPQDISGPRYRAVARLRTGDTNEYLVGQVEFMQWQQDGPTTIVAVLQIPPYMIRNQFLAMNIHDYGDVSDSCRWVGQHYNPYHQIHGGPMDPVRHVGDLGNLSPTGNIVLVNTTNNRVQLTGLKTVIGRSLVIHLNGDDYGRGGASNSMVDGNSGPPLACGVIGVKGDFSPATGVNYGPCNFGFYLISFCLLLFFRRT